MADMSLSEYIDILLYYTFAEEILKKEKLAEEIGPMLRELYQPTGEQK